VTEESGSDEKTLVCVTGASGYVGSHVTRELLERGYRVRATVRDAEDPSKTAHLRGLATDAEDSLELFSADLLEHGSFDRAIDGCVHVYHVASTVQLAAKDPQREIIDVAVRGTENVLGSALRAGTVERVGLMSSMAAVASQRPRPNHVFSEDDWDEDADLKSSPYPLSKVLAERAAWKFHDRLPEAKRFEMVVVNPVMVVGPVYARVHLRSSVSMIRQIMRGKLHGCPDLAFGYVDVRDVATAFVNGVEQGAPTGRYILHAKSMWLREVAETIAPHFPELRIPTRKLPNLAVYAASLFDKRANFTYLRRHIGRMDAVSHAKAEAVLGIQFRPVEESLIDTCRSFVDLGLV
jgi:dihydroflavonol-4-reductase